MKMKKFFALLLSLSMVLSLAACGSKGNSNDSQTDGETASDLHLGYDINTGENHYGPYYDEWSDKTDEELFEEALKEDTTINVYATSSKMMKVEEGFEAAYPGLDLVVSDLKTDEVLSERLKDLDNAVVPGFYGAKPDGSVKTFSRGGSDITGSIVAKAVHADIYENWTDVSGFLVTDPRIVKDPEVISTITYRELRELSYMGATVLHEDSIFPLRQEGIPIHVLNTNAPQDPGTMIVENTCSKPKFTITGIAGKKGFASITIEKSMMNTEIGFGRKVLGVFEDNNLSFEHMPSGIDTMTVFVHQSEFAAKEQQVIAGLHRAVQPDSIDLESDLALIAVVGRGMRRTRGTAGRIFSALAHAHVNVKMIDQGSSELNIIIGVENRDFETAIKAIYDIFVVAQI